MASNIIETAKPKRSFNLRSDDRFLERDLPEQAVKAIRVLDKICTKIETLAKVGSDEVPLSENTLFLISYTTRQALSAYEEGVAYGAPTRKAYLPKVYRHLLVKIAKNFKDPMPVFQKFSNNADFIRLLDEAWINPAVGQAVEAEQVAKPKPAKAATSGPRVKQTRRKASTSPTKRKKGVL